MGYNRVFNFSAGPAVMPESVLEQARDELLNFKNSGMSVMEMSHRSKEFDAVIEGAEARMKKLLNIPDTHAVLFLQGGATGQFAMIPYNFYRGEQHPIDLVYTGAWSEKAMKEAKKIAKVNVVASSEDRNFMYMPDVKKMKFNPQASYVHICSNETISGAMFKEFPDTGDIPLVADMSSEILSRPLDISKFDLIFAGAQKNLGPSGICLVIINKEWAAKGRKDIPEIWSYEPHIKNGSRLNTPPTFGIYLTGLVLEWVEKNGGVAKMAQLAKERSSILYAAIDSSGGFYNCPVDKQFRSEMNPVFRIKGGDEIEERFCKEAKKAGLDGLKGHRSVGGLRASIYNAFPIEGVKALVDFMKEFQKKNG